ncbi:MAG: TIGR00375 family protein [Halobacteriota archaeon]|nr:TIGR00375 family protein [Halobacteriota archaeon]
MDIIEVAADLHIHSKYSAATSSRMDLQTLAEGSRKKGVELLGTGDCLHPKWLSEIKRLEESDGIFTQDDIKFILTTEVEDINRVHHLLIIPSISKGEELYELFLRYSHNIDTDGRPRIDLDGEEVAEYARDVSALIGPAHAFTPWTSLYAHHDSLNECYKDLRDYISFIELGLSADSDYADRISELRSKAFLSNSDAHSPWPIRLARELNRMKLGHLSFEEVEKAIKNEGGRRLTLNVGMPPQEGKYNETACSKCYKHQPLKDSLECGFKCSCGGKIVRGVRDRVDELAVGCKTQHPDERPPYLHLIPLAEIIAMALGLKPNSETVKKNWNSLVSEYGNEATVLVDIPTNDMVVDKRIAESIQAFRDDKVIVRPGGGGKYGTIELPNPGSSQKSLFDF